MSQRVGCPTQAVLVLGCCTLAHSAGECCVSSQASVDAYLGSNREAQLAAVLRSIETAGQRQKDLAKRIEVARSSTQRLTAVPPDAALTSRPKKCNHSANRPHHVPLLAAGAEHCRLLQPQNDLCTWRCACEHTLSANISSGVPVKPPRLRQRDAPAASRRPGRFAPGENILQTVAN